MQIFYIDFSKKIVVQHTLTHTHGIQIHQIEKKNLYKKHSFQMKHVQLYTIFLLFLYLFQQHIDTHEFSNLELNFKA